jgi:hypothetical protein
MKLKHIAEVLKEHEVYCYQIAYFILEHEEYAVLAAKQALIELGCNDGFLTDSAEERWRTAKKVCVRHSLEVSILPEFRKAVQ